MRTGFHPSHSSGLRFPFQIQVAVAIAEETIIVVQGMFIYPLPFVTQVGSNEQEQGALWLMKIGDHAVSKPEPITRNDDNLGRC